MASSFVVILTVITTMTRKDDVIQGRGVITESFACAYMESLLVSPDGAWSRQMVPWAVKRVIVQFAFGPRCVLCDERPGSLCRIGDAYELRCLTCMKGMIDVAFPFPEPLVDGIICEEWSFVSCPIGSSLRDLSGVSEYSVL